MFQNTARDFEIVRFRVSRLTCYYRYRTLDLTQFLVGVFLDKAADERAFADLGRTYDGYNQRGRVHWGSVNHGYVFLLLLNVHRPRGTQSLVSISINVVSLYTIRAGGFNVVQGA